MNQDTIQKIYDEIGQLQLELEPDPTILGPRYINEITARCRNHLNRVTHIRLRLSREKRTMKSQLSGEETLLQAERDRLLAEDETVRRQPNMRDREAVANTILRERLNIIAQLKSELLDLDTVEKAVVLVHDELIRTSHEIKTQRSLILADRSSGAAYGDEYDGPRDGKGRVLPPQSTIDETELDLIMSGGDTTAPIQSEATSPAVVPSPAQEEAPGPLPVGMEVELPAELAAIGKSEPVLDLEVLPPALKAVESKSKFVDQPVPAKDPSAGLDEDQDVLSFLDSDFKVEVVQETPKPVVSTTAPAKSAKVDDDDDFLSSLLQNI